MSLIRGKGRLAAVTSLSSVALPFTLALLAAPVLHAEYGTVDGEEVDLLHFGLFLGAAMSVTAFPVLARILTERNMHRTRIGVLTLACAAVDDILAWSLLAAVLAVVGEGELGPAVGPRADRRLRRGHGAADPSAAGEARRPLPAARATDARRARRRPRGRAGLVVPDLRDRHPRHLRGLLLRGDLPPRRAPTRCSTRSSSGSSRSPSSCCSPSSSWSPACSWTSPASASTGSSTCCWSSSWPAPASSSAPRWPPVARGSPPARPWPSGC